MKKICWLFIFVALLGAGAAFAGRGRLAQIFTAAAKLEIPPAQSVEEFVATSSGSQRSSEVLPPREVKPRVEAPEKLNLAVPFTVQAPHANWVQPYEDACEEASSAMVHYYYSQQKFANADAADAELKEVFSWEDQTFGTNKDTTAEQTARILREHYGHKRVLVRYDITAEDIRAELRAGRPVIVPAYGKALGNPYFKNGGPVYHMLVIKGYIGDDTFITNDPGTRRGADYVYNVKTLMNAIHDWNGGDVPNGRKVMIVTY